MSPQKLDEFQGWLKKQADESQKRNSVYFSGRAGALSDAFEYLSILRMQSTGATGSAVPMTAGFYWWRPNRSTRWSLIKLRSIPHLPPHAADDVSHGSFFGRPVKGWADDWPVGEWVRIEPPNASASATEGRP